MSGPRWTAVFILLLACAVRLAAILPIDSTLPDDVDESEYLALAQNIRLHGTFSYGRQHVGGESGRLDTPGPYEPTAGRAPLYPLAIAALWWGKAPPLAGMQLLQVLLGGLVALFVYLITLRAFDARAARLAGLAMALSPVHVFYTSQFFPQILFTFLLAAAIWLCGRGQGVGAGLFLGAAALTRSVVVPLLGLVALAALLFRFRRGVHIALIAGALLMIVPWTVRNLATQHAFIPVASMGWGANIFLGTFDPPYGGTKRVWELADEDGTLRHIAVTSPGVTEAEGRMFREGLSRIAAGPLHWLWVRTKQYPRLLMGTPHYLLPDAPVPRWMVNAVYFAGDAALIGLAFLGLILAWPRWRDVYYIAAFPIFLGIAQFPALTEERLGLDLLPPLMVFAGFGAAEIWRRYSAAALRAP